MDDCDLETLTAAPAKLSPRFDRNVCEYLSTVPSKVGKVNIDCLTRDSGASYQIIGSSGERDIPLKEGCVNEIKIEVTAEDGTIKNYVINIKRLSASDALLTSLKITNALLEPKFSFEIDEYSCTVPCNCCEVSVSATAPEKSCEIVVNGEELTKPVKLNCGETEVTVAVKSVDKSSTRNYTIGIVRKQLLWPIFMKNKDESKRYECPMTLGPVYCPLTIVGSEPKVTMTQSCLDMLTRRSKVNPIDETPLESSWRKMDFEIDKTTGNVLCNSVYKYKGCNDDITLHTMCDHALTSSHKPPEEVDNSIITGSDWYKAEFESSSGGSGNQIKHTMQIRNWEKRLQHMASGGNAEQLVKEAEKNIKLYREKLPKRPGDSVSYAPNEAPSDYLQQASICYAAAIKSKPKDVKLHLALGNVLEEQYYFDDMYELGKKETSDEFVKSNLEAQETSKEDDITAICKLRGIGAHAPLTQKLKAIDEEYHHLLDSGMSSKADYVQMLYAWKSKQALKEGQSAANSTDEGNTLGQAALKYLDALATDPSNHVANVEVGRMCVMQGEHGEAIVRLQQALGIKPSNMLARFLLGIAIYKQTGGAGNRLKESLQLMHDGLTNMLQKRLKEACVAGEDLSSDLIVMDQWRMNNTEMLRGMFCFAEALQNHPTENMRSAKDVYHLICLLVSTALCNMHGKNDIFRQLEHLLLNCHFALLEVMMKESPSDVEWIAQRCQYLSAMIRSVTIPQSTQLLKLQKSVCEKLVTIQPCSSNSLHLLGMIQLAQYDHDSTSDSGKLCLVECRASFEASIALEGKPAAGSLPETIAKQKWWQDKMAEEKAKQEKMNASTTAAKPAAGKPAAARGRGGPPARGRSGPALRGATAPRGRGTAAPARNATAIRGGRGRAASTASSSQTKCDKNKTPAQAAPTQPAISESSPSPAVVTGPLNKITFLARLGLARALSRTDDAVKQAQERYQEVIKMAPEVHDAYIELADMLVKTDPLEAVNVYCSFPKTTSDEASDSFDDAYLSGEIVRILMKHEKFDDPRLCEHMVAWGRIMGIGILEKYMGILDEKFKTNLLKSVYAGVHRKDVEDPDLKDFFKFKCWI